VKARTSLMARNILHASSIWCTICHVTTNKNLDKNKRPDRNCCDFCPITISARQKQDFPVVELEPGIERLPLNLLTPHKNFHQCTCFPDSMKLKGCDWSSVQQRIFVTSNMCRFHLFMRLVQELGTASGPRDVIICGDIEKMSKKMQVAQVQGMDQQIRGCMIWLVVPEEIIITHVHPQVRLTNGESLHMAPQAQTGKICHWNI